MPLSQSVLAEARSAFDEGRYRDAITTLAVEHRAGNMSPASVRLAQEAYMKVGELHRALGEMNRLRRLAPSTETDALTRRLLGRLIETDPEWLPDVGERTVSGSPPGEPNRILHFLKESIPYSETGFTMRSRMTLAAQRLAGFTPEVITSLGFPRSKGVTDFPQSQILDEVRHHHLDVGTNVRTMPADVALELNTRLAARIADAFLPQLVQSGTGYRGFETALMGIALADRYDVPFVYEVRGFQEATWTGNVALSESGEYYRRRHRQEDRCMHRAERVITIGTAMADEIIERRVDADKVAVVPNAVDVNRFTPRGKQPDLIERYGLGDRFVVGYISNLGAREGLDHLIRAIGILRSRNRDVICFIAGDGPERPRLESLVRELDLERHVVLAGHVPNERIEDHYALIDLFVVPRIDDRAARMVTPLKPLEAMSMELPVIASSLPALEELVAPGERGTTFAPADPSALADVVDSLMSDSTTRSRFARSGREWVLQERTLQSNADRYERILSPLI